MSRPRTTPTGSLSAAPRLEDLLIPHKVVVNDETYLPEWHLVASLACIYNRDTTSSLVIARLCDDYLDPRGALLGKVRNQARSQREVSPS